MEPLKKHGMDLSKLIDAVLKEVAICQSQTEEGKKEEDEVGKAIDRINKSIRNKE